MEMIYYTLAGIVLYFAADWILDRIEQAIGHRFSHRNVLFFVIILLLSVGTFQLLQSLLPVPPTSG